MRAALLVLVVAGACYEPRFERCSVRCAFGVGCPDDLECLDDYNCHEPGDDALCPLDTLQVIVEKAGTGGGVVTGPDINCGATCTAAVLEGSEVTLSAAADDTSRFDTWSGAGCAADPCTFTIEDDVQVTAHFIAQRSLTVQFPGAGTGTVVIDPPGVSCSVDCTEIFDHGTELTLTATPEDPSVFVGWGGHCNGMTECKVTMDGMKVVTARFEP